jgi:hypothetical protein
LSLILILNFGSLFSQSKENKLLLNDTWFGSTGTDNGKPVIIRGREDLNNFIESGLYNERIEMVWSLEDPTENGLPSPEVGIFMGKIEDTLIETLEKDLQSVLTVVYTHDNIRSWIFYSKSVNVFLERLNVALAEYPKIPIEILNNTDKEWDTYNQFLGVYNNQ